MKWDAANEIHGKDGVEPAGVTTQQEVEERKRQYE
jgi:hypothetical protein